MPVRKGSTARRLANNPGKRPVEAPIKPPPGIPERPASLKGEAADEWDRVVPVLDAMGILSVLDRAVICDYCQCWADICRVTGELENAPSLVEGRSDSAGMVKNHLWSILNQLRQRFDKKAEMLGLAPGPRGRLDTPDRGLDDDSHGLLD